MRIPLFKMERMQSTVENTVEFNLSESGVHPMRVEALLDGAFLPGDCPHPRRAHRLLPSLDNDR